MLWGLGSLSELVVSITFSWYGRHSRNDLYGSKDSFAAGFLVVRNVLEQGLKAALYQQAGMLQKIFSHLVMLAPCGPGYWTAV